MDVVWESKRELSAREVADLFPDHAYTTLATVLNRRVRKGLIRRRSQGRICTFSAVETGAMHTAMLMHEAVVASNDREATLTRFARMISPSDARTLVRALSNQGRDGSKRTSHQEA